MGIRILTNGDDTMATFYESVGMRALGPVIEDRHHATDVAECFQLYISNQGYTGLAEAEAANQLWQFWDLFAGMITSLRRCDQCESLHWRTCDTGSEDDAIREKCADCASSVVDCANCEQPVEAYDRDQSHCAECRRNLPGDDLEARYKALTAPV